MNRYFVRKIRSWRQAFAYREESANALYGIACIYSLRGDKEMALAFLERSLQEGFTDLDQIKRSPDMNSVRDDYGWKNLVARYS